MFKHIMIALALITLTPATVFAKVPFKADAERAPAVSSLSSTAAVKTASLQRYKRAGVAIPAERLAACTHTHRYSSQHRM